MEDNVSSSTNKDGTSTDGASIGGTNTDVISTEGTSTDKTIIKGRDASRKKVLYNKLVNIPQHTAIELIALIAAIIQSLLLLGNQDMTMFWQVIVIILLIIYGLLLLDSIRRLCAELKKVIVRPNETKVCDYLDKWIDDSGRLAIVSRDLSWVKDKIKTKLINKAKNGELIVILPKNNEISRKLMDAGAEVRYYLYGGESKKVDSNVLQSRFMIAGYEANPRMTIPKISIDQHINDEFSSGDHQTHVSSDIVDIILKNTHKTEPFKQDQDEDITTFIFNRLEYGGRCFILSRDLSWANNCEKLRNCLINKSHNDEIVIVMQKECELSKELIQEGAEVRYYQKLNYNVTSRFIITHWGTMEAELTFRTYQDKMHINHIYDSSHRIHAYAVEMSEILYRLINNETSPQV